MLSHCVLGILGVLGCAVVIHHERSYVFLIFELSVLAMLGVHGYENAMLDVRS